MLLLVPSVWGIFLLNKPLIKVSKSEPLTEHNDTDSVDFFQRYENSLIKLSPEIWKKLNIDNQLDLAQTIVNIESESLGIPPVQVVADAQPKSLYGEYSLTANNITINLSLLAKNDATEFVRTLCHEVRHSYQHYVVELIDWNDFNTAKLSLFSDARLWKTDFDSTEITNDYDKYYNRNIEIDAREYSDARLEMYIGFLKGNQLSLEN